MPSGTHISTALLNALQSQDQVSGLTHNFYRYPARFSPLFVREAIQAFTGPGDLIIDPFMGGGTTLVEARVLARAAIGVDISDLSVFVATVKTTPLLKRDLGAVAEWSRQTEGQLSIKNHTINSATAEDSNYKRNLTGRLWPIRKAVEIALSHLSELRNVPQQRLARCAMLRTAQWALDCKTEIPSLSQFRVRFLANVEQMCNAVALFSNEARIADRLNRSAQLRTLSLKRSAIGIEGERQVTNAGPPRLILTSPPYPGVHVLYHRWQIKGRKETPAPFWIANCLDGSGESYYAMGNRKQLGLKDYYDGIRDAFTSLSKISDANTVVIQLLAFSEPSWQLPSYLEAMQQAGFSELLLAGLSKVRDSRLWRDVPNRKWYAQQKGPTPSSREVVLLHKLTKN